MIEGQIGIGIVGTRRRDDFISFRAVRNALTEIIGDGDWIVSGGCPEGGDKFAEDLAKKDGIPILIFYPAWHIHGRAAGFVRNTNIAKMSDMLIACVAEDRKGGTEDTIKKFINSIFQLGGISSPTEKAAVDGGFLILV